MPETNPGKALWGFDVQKVWVPFFEATNAGGETQIPEKALREPLRRDKDGHITVAREIEDAVRTVRGNFELVLLDYIEQTRGNTKRQAKAPKWIKNMTTGLYERR